MVQQDDKYTEYKTPSKNIVWAVLQGVYEFPGVFIRSFHNEQYSNHSIIGKFQISLLQTFIRNMHYKQLLFFSPNRTIKRQLERKVHKYGAFNNYGKEFLPGTIWLVEKPGRTTKDPVILFYHGGGYIFQFRTDTHLKFLDNLVKALPSNYSILLIDYPLESHPNPLEYNIQLCEKLFNDLGLENIITMGDSAGAHLILSTLAHIQQNKLQITIPSRFRHVFISPWIDLSLGPPSILKNNDILDPQWINKWGHIHHNNSLDIIDLETFEFDSNLIKDSIIIVGELELFFETSLKFAKKNGIDFIVEKQGVHDQVTMEKLLGYDDGEMFDKIVEFITKSE